MDLGRLTSVLSAKQIRSIAEAQARINLWDGAIRSGKTIASLLRWLMYVADAPESGELVVIAKTSITASRNVFGPLMDFNLFGELASQTSYVTGAASATILGRRVWVIGANDSRAETRLRGLTCSGCYVDEASLVPEQFFTQLLGRMSVPGAKMFATTNPDSPAHWLRKHFLSNPNLDLRNWHFALHDNPSLTPEYIAAISAEFTGLWYRRFILGEWVAAEGAVYDMFDETKHVVDLVPPISTWLCVAVDYGTTNPFHAVLLGIGTDPAAGPSVQRRECLYGVSEWRWDARQQHRQLTDAEYATRMKQWLANVRFPGTHLRGPQVPYLVIDPSAASFKVQAYQDGWNVTDGDNSVLDGIRLVSTLLAGERLKFSRTGCPALIEEFPAYSWDDKAALAGRDEVIKINDHGLDATRYGINTTRPLWNNRIPLTTAA